MVSVNVFFLNWSDLNNPSMYIHLSGMNIRTRIAVEVEAPHLVPQHHLGANTTWERPQTRLKNLSCKSNLILWYLVKKLHSDIWIIFANTLKYEADIKYKWKYAYLSNLNKIQMFQILLSNTNKYFYLSMVNTTAIWMQKSDFRIFIPGSL